MNTEQKKVTIKIVNKMIENNWQLLSLLSKMSEEDKLVYIPIVKESIEETDRIIKSVTA